jgi:hypothetical protein
MTGPEVRILAPVGSLRVFRLHSAKRPVVAHVIEYGRAWVYVGEHPNLLRVPFSDIDGIDRYESAART